MRAVREGRFPPCRQRRMFCRRTRSIGCARSRSLCSQVVENLCHLCRSATRTYKVCPRQNGRQRLESASGRGVAALSARSERVAHCAFIDAPILYFGRLSVEKGVIDLVRAMRLIPNIRLIIAGDGPQREELEAKAAELGIEECRTLRPP